MDLWIQFTLLAAAMQTARMAAQKSITRKLSPLAVTTVRYAFGLPFALLYLMYVCTPGAIYSATIESPRLEFYAYAILAGVAQIAATLLLVKLLTHRNFAVATILSKTEAIQLAILGFLFIGTHLSWQEWLAVCAGCTGVCILSYRSTAVNFDAKSMLLGLLSGSGFALTALWIREATLVLDLPFVQRAALTLAFITLIQSLLCLLLTAAIEKRQLRLMRSQLAQCAFIGITSTAVSIGWFTALALENAALVRTLGQVEVLFSLMVTYCIFGERLLPKEWMGAACLVAGVTVILIRS